MKNATRILLLALCCNAFGQQYTDTTITKDYNYDGTLDTLNYFSEYGSGFGGVDYKITDGKTNEVFELSNYGSYGRSKILIRIPPSLLKKENEGFLDAFIKGLLPKKRNVPEASLQWILDATFGSHTLKDSIYFDKIFTPNTVWLTAPYEPPSSYYIEVEGDSLLKLENTFTLKHADSLPAKKPKGFLIYLGSTIRDGELFVDRKDNPEGGLMLVGKNDTYKIYKTKHAVLAKKGTAFKWLFVSDGDITNAPEKLRWNSIGKVILKDDYLIFKQDLAPDNAYNVYVVHIESGTFGRLTLDFDSFLDDIFLGELSEAEELSVIRNNIVIGRGTNALRVPLDEIEKTFNAYMTKE